MPLGGGSCINNLIILIRDLVLIHSEYASNTNRLGHNRVCVIPMIPSVPPLFMVKLTEYIVIFDLPIHSHSILLIPALIIILLQRQIAKGTYDIHPDTYHRIAE